MLARTASICWFMGLVAFAAAPARGQDIFLAWAAVMTDAPPPPASDRVERTLLRETAAQLSARAPTFRQMLAAVAAAPHLHVTIRPIVGGSVMGRSHYWVHNEWTYGVMDVQLSRRDPYLRMRAVAHEVAHAAEIACHPAFASTGDLQTALRLRRRAGLPDPYEGETAFAEAAERTVVAEYGVRSTSAGALPDLATRFRLGRCGDAVP